MATQLQIRRGTSTQVAAFTGAEGEIVVNTTNDSVHVNDGSTAGGFELARADFNNISASATLTIGTLNTTNLDLTNLEVTNIKAKDGTAAGSIADSTGVVTLISSSLTTADITTLKIGGTTVTSTAAELNILDGVTSTAAELNILDGVTATTAELNYVDGVTSAIQTQIDAKAPIANPTFTGSFTSPGIDDNADAIAITIDSSENVGIGEPSPDTLLMLTGDAAALTIEDNGSYSADSVSSFIGFNGKDAAGSNRDLAYINIGQHAGGNGTGSIDFQTRISGTVASRLKIDQSGNVGIGTSSAGTFRTKIKHSAASVTTGLGIEASANDSVLRVFHSGSLAGFNATYSSTGAYVPLVFNVGSGGEAMRLGTDGNVGIGADNPDQNLVVKSAADTQIKIVSGASNDAYLTFYNGTSLNHYFKQDNSGLFELYYYDGSAANSRVAVDTSGTTTFSVPLINFGASGGSQHQVFPAFTSTSNLIQNYDGSAYTSEEHRASSFTWRLGTARAMAIDSSGTVMDYITSSGGNADLRYHTGTSVVSYDTSSERFKTNIRDNTTYGLAAVNALQSRMFEYKDDGRTDVGLIAEEVAEVVPELVGLDDENNPLTVDYKRFVSVLVKAMQEQQEQIEALTTRIAALEGE